MNTTWTNFYQRRTGSSYKEYAAKRYQSFISMINHLNPMSTVEEGIGIGTITSLIDSKYKIGFDINPEMVEMAKTNSDVNRIEVDDIVNPTTPLIVQHYDFFKEKTLAITHGVLEHFNDNIIIEIMNRYKRTNTPSIHYVPLNKYKVPSFGDERLLPFEHWVDLIKPDEYGLFNDGHDFWFHKQ